MKHSFLTVNLLTLLLYFSLAPALSFGQTVMNNATIDEGGSYTDVIFNGTVSIYTTQKVTFYNCTFRSSENGINIYEGNGGDVEVTYCTFEGLNPNQYGETQGKAVHAWRPAAIKLEHNTGVGFRGFWIQEPKVGGPISVRYNHWTNIAGRPSDGNGGYLDEPDPNGENSQFVMVTDVQGGNVGVEWNYVKNVAYEGKVEDVLNFFRCKGTANNPLIMSNNLVVGSYPYDPVSIQNYSGSGIQVEAESEYVHIKGNYMINNGNTGIALSWTTNCKAFENKIIHSGKIFGTNQYVCQVWRGLLLGNPFWHPDDSFDNEGYDNLVWYPQNINTCNGNSGSQIQAPIECLNNNNCYNNEQPSGFATHQDELDAIDEWWGIVDANGLTIGNDGSTPPAPPTGGGGGGTTNPPPSIDTAHDNVPSHDGSFLVGADVLKIPGWSYNRLGNILAGNPGVAGADGVGGQAVRLRLREWEVEDKGYDFYTNNLNHYANTLGMQVTGVLGYPMASHKDASVNCGNASQMFDKLYEDIWDGGANGTEVNEDNLFANYVYQLVSENKDQVKYWSVMDSVDFTTDGASTAADWWNNDPDACDLDQLNAPVYDYIRMLRIAYEVIRYLDADAMVVLGGIQHPSFLDAILRNTDNPSNGDVDTDYPETGGAYFDVLSMVAYPHEDAGVQSGNRHSDAAAASVATAVQEMKDILDQYDYDGNNYPAKHISLAHTGVPRESMNGAIGGEEAQRNFIVKAALVARESGLISMHYHCLNEMEDMADADEPSEIMGLYESLFRDLPYAQVYTGAAVLQKTFMDLTTTSTFDAGRTSQLNLPSGTAGAAYEMTDGTFCYMLWAKTSTDGSENATETYDFPTAFGLTAVTRRDWDYTLTEIEDEVAATGIQLSATPAFFLDNVTTIPPVVPVTEFGNISATPDYAQELVKVEWTTDSELENDFFTMQRSVDGVVYQDVETVSSLGNSSNEQAYEVYDWSPVQGTLYYRVKQTSTDGSFTYSDVVEVNYDPTVQAYIECYPVPITKGDPLNVEFLLETDVSHAIVVMRQIQGRRVYRAIVPVTPGVNTVQVPTTGRRRRPGNYYVVVKTYFERHAQLITIVD